MYVSDGRDTAYIYNTAIGNPPWAYIILTRNDT